MRQGDDPTAHTDAVRTKLYDDLITVIDATSCPPRQQTPDLLR